MITIKASHIGKDYLRVFPSWISNGHWSVRRTEVANDPLFASLASTKVAFPSVRDSQVLDSDGDMDRILRQFEGKTTLQKFSVTPWQLQQQKRMYALLTCNAAATFVDCSYLNLLQVQTSRCLYGKDNSSVLTDDERSFVVMPYGFRNLDLLLELRSLIHLQDIAADTPAVSVRPMPDRRQK